MSRTPVRTCVGCGVKRPQSELVRVAHAPDQIGLAIDARRRLPGRGAYFCRDARCWQAGAARRGLDRALRASVPAAARQELVRALMVASCLFGEAASAAEVGRSEEATYEEVKP